MVTSEPGSCMIDYVCSREVLHLLICAPGGYSAQVLGGRLPVMVLGGNVPLCVWQEGPAKG